jgi:23S rRNA pseudouridine2605 synthase
MEERLQKILAQAGVGSRRTCETYIADGRVTVNGRRAQLGQKADPARDRIEFDGDPLSQSQALVYVMLHKPRGVVSSLAAQGDRKTVRDLVPLAERLYPVGRLDVDSEGLILLTNDGALTERLTHPRYEVEKEYRVLVASRGAVDEEQLAAWRRGVTLEGKRTAPAHVTREKHGAGVAWLRVIMHEGRKHEIRDIAQTLGMPVMRLVRVRLGSLRLGNLKPGAWRGLTPDEVRGLRETSSARTPSARSPKARTPKARRPDGRAARRGPVRSGAKRHRL